VKWGATINLRCKNLAPPMSQLGQSQTFDDVCITSVKPPIADSCPTSREVRDGRSAANCSLFDHFVGAGEQRLIAKLKLGWQLNSVLVPNFCQSHAWNSSYRN